MSTLRKFIVSVLCLGASTGTSIWINVSGWGLSAHSWSIIIWGAVIQFLIIVALQVGTADDK